MTKPPKTAAVLSIGWRNPYTQPPAEVPLLPCGRLRWAVTLLDRSAEAELLRDQAPAFKPGSGWTVAFTTVQTEPPRRWSAEAKGRVRRRNLRWRLERKCPLFAELLYREALAQRPAHYYPQEAE